MKMHDYIYEQPFVLARILANRKDNLSNFISYYQQVNPDHVYLIACGSSYNEMCIRDRSVGRAVTAAREKIKAEMKKYLSA